LKLIEPGPEVAAYGLRAMTMVARAAEGGLGHDQRALLAAAQKVILHTEMDVDGLTPISPEELVSHVVDPEIRRQLTQGMVVMSIVDGPASPSQAELIASFAKALDVDEPAVKVVRDLAEHELLMFRLDFYRRSHMVDAIKSQYRRQGGIMAVARGLLGLKGLVEDKELALRFHALGELPENTLGYCFYRHYVDHGFPFPGEKGGFPMAAVYHDFAHVLSGNPPDPEGEILVGAFQAGFRRTENAFFIVLFVVLTFSSGINMTPFKKVPVRGRLGQGDMAERMLGELKRGAAMNTDLGNDWDFWPYVHRGLEEVRAELGVLPRGN